MNPIFKKLNFKGQNPVLALESPDAFRPVMEEMTDLTTFDESIDAQKQYSFAIVFVEQSADLLRLAPITMDALTQEDPIFWVAYPKKSSKRYTSDIHRDTDIWQILGDRGFEGVRSVAIDDDWSALRFRRVAFIKSMKRESKRAMTQEGKKRTK